MASRTLAQTRLTPALPARDVMSQLKTELTLEITPRGGVFYKGSAAQLVDEGVIPPDFGSDGPDRREWSDGELSFLLVRSKPAGVSVKAWRAGSRDHWSVYCSRVGRHGAPGPVLSARVHAARQELAEAELIAGPIGEIRWHLVCAAKDDKAFQRMLAQVVRAPA